MGINTEDGSGSYDFQSKQVASFDRRFKTVDYGNHLQNEKIL